MKWTRSTALLIATSLIAACIILFAVALSRYVSRPQEDWTGIGLYSAAILGLTVSGCGFFLQWRRERGAEKKRTREEQMK